jgi:hypothetical protein
MTMYLCSSIEERESATIYRMGICLSKLHIYQLIKHDLNQTQSKKKLSF